MWPTGERDVPGQLRVSGYVPDTWGDVNLIPPAVVRHAVSRYSQPGSLVVDPDCGAGTVAVEAIRAGRHGVGVTRHAEWWQIARANLSMAKRGGAWPDGLVLDGENSLCWLGLRRRVDLVVTTLRLPAVMDEDDLDLLVRPQAAVWSSVVRAGGYVVVVVQQRRYRVGELVDLTSAVMAAGSAMGLDVVDRSVALIARLRDVRGGLVPLSRRRRWPAIVAHHDVVVLRARELVEGTAEEGIGTWRAA
ncbi:hypothetical protein GCM10029964_060840 [Kibdelosporangium lantanae]